MKKNKLKTYISKLKDIQFLRNGIVHNASIFSKISKVSNIVKKYKQSLGFDIENNSLRIINSKFIKDFILLLKNFYEQLFWLLDIRQESIIIKNGLSHWFGFIDNKISINSIKIEKTTETEKVISFFAVPHNNSIQKFKGKITLKKMKQNSFDYTNQTGDSKIESFLKNEKKIQGNNFMEIFEPFNLHHSTFARRIMLSNI